ncbi:MAG: amidohydrolase family protein [Terriglobales bacterium]
MENLRLRRLLRSFVILTWIAALVAPLASLSQEGAQPAVTEQGKFTLHKFEQAIGQETYTITREGGSLVASMDFKFTDRGQEVPLTAMFRGASDLTPESFEIKGKTSRATEIDRTVEVTKGKVRLRNREHWTETAPLPSPFFTIAGYAPTTMQMLLVRYWATHGSPAKLATLPSGSVKITPRGQDSIAIDGHKEKMQRYTIEGLIWGRETLWFDAHQTLVAAVTTDAEFDHFEAIREGYESALGDFVRRAGSDGMAALAEVSEGISGSQAKTLAIVGATLIDGTGSAAVPDAAVVIEDGRIVAVGPRSGVQIPPNATLVDARGKTLLPGLWDMHAHFEQVEWGPIYLAAGVTTVRDCGNEFEFITAVRDAIAQGRGLGPRLLLAGIVDGSGRETVGVERVDTPEQARAWTDRYHETGFQQMKIYSSVKLEEVKAVTEEAHRLGMTVTGHVPEGLTAYQVVEAGQDQINHVGYILDMMHAPFPSDMNRPERQKALADIDLNSSEAGEAIAFLKEHHTVIDPTMALFEFLTASTAKPPASFEPGVTTVAPELAEQLLDVGPPSSSSELREKVFEKELALVGRLHQAGVPIVAGTDQTVPGYSLHREIELYVQAGFTPMEAIQAATIVPARVMGLDKEVGTIEPGKRADLIILNGNPLEDIRNTRNVEYVITNGKMFHCAELWESVGFKP